MMKTIIIAVCSAVAYLAIVIGLTVYCSLRMMRAKNLRKQRESEAALQASDKAENGTVPTEHTELMEKREHDSSVIKSDVDARSHISGVSSHPSHSSHSHQSHNSGRLMLEKLAFPRRQLQTLGMLGKGHYGDVFLAKAHLIREGEPETLVIIKSLLSREEYHHQEFCREIEMFSKLTHEHIAKVLGVCCDMEPRFLITEYSDWGDLKQYLWATRKDNGRRIRPLTAAQKATMCSQVALGMEFMAANRFIHRDLAARNMLLSSTLDLKISNLSLCRDVYATEYFPFHQQLIPLRWMPPEAVLEDEYSTKSDVWSYGVFIWELFMLGELPHHERMDEEVLKGLKAGGEPLDMPPECPQELYQLTLKCTAEFAKDRPSFSEIVSIINSPDNTRVCEWLNTCSAPSADGLIVDPVKPQAKQAIILGELKS
ncbi:hypothetical protein LSH36_463g04014 [Paralvinella palmiformis]|uniref:Protein kinase domain-containing protein n=1 Tax=Paralvinella palmiformis TaxID=53620 RepID=A0AAD9MX89_9ANNE|nr:hypothetical protein LSH36_463g04014 [Paralvinella palmiformis]